MDAEAKPTQYLVLNEFLARNPCINRRTFTRWKKRGLIDFIQPGGPNTRIYVPVDALDRIERSNIKASQSGGGKDNSAKVETEPLREVEASTPSRLSGPSPQWKKKLIKNKGAYP